MAWSTKYKKGYKKFKKTYKKIKKVYKKFKKYTRRYKTPSYKSSVEKKFVETRTTSTLDFAKNSSVGNSGHLLFQYDNTTASNVNQFFPRISQGLDFTDRTGNELKLTGLYLNCRVSGQPAFRSGGEYRIIIFGKKHESCQLTSDFSLNQFLDYDRMENQDVYSTSSQRNPEFYRQFVVYYNKKFRLNGDYYMSGINVATGAEAPASTFIPQVDTFRDHHIKIKFNRSVRYDRKETNPNYETLSYGDLCLVVLANKGENVNDTGLEWNHFARWYFTDS